MADVATAIATPLADMVVSYNRDQQIYCTPSKQENQGAFPSKGGASMEISNNTAMKEVFCRYIRKNGRIIYPKNARFFHFWVPVKSEMDSNYEQMTMFDADEL